MASMLPFVPAIIGAGLGYLGVRSQNAAAAAEAEKNRDFQERMSSSSHQRDVRDLMLAGLNPVLSGHGGASTPGGSVAPVENKGEGANRGIASALAVKQAQANIELTRAQTRREDETASYTRVQSGDLQTQAASGRYAEISSRADLAALSVQQQRELFPIAVERAREELRLAGANVRNAQLVGDLNELVKEGSAANIAAFEKRMGEVGPGVRFLLDLMRVYNAAAGQPITRVP